jgi:hypothetical protein
LAKTIPIKNGDDRSLNNRWVAKAIYGFAINPLYDDVLTDDERQKFDKTKKVDQIKFYIELLKTIKSPKIVMKISDIILQTLNFQMTNCCTMILR